MRLCFVTGSLVHGGAERHAITLANRLAERGHEVHFAYVKNDPSQLPRLKVENVTCLDAKGYFDPKGIRDLAGWFKRAKPKAVLATNPYALLYASLARPDAPLAVALHSTFCRTAKEWLQMLAYRPLFWSAERAFFVCERQMRHWRRRGLFARSNEVIYNGVDLDYWVAQKPALRPVLGFSENDFVIGLSAVLRPEKNPVQLVEAIAGLRRRGVPARALMIGDGEMRPAIEAAARRLGVAQAVTITGLVQDVRPFLAACDVLTLTSRTEAFSLAAVEAMALERPVVHADVGGAAEMIRPGHDGFLFPAGDTGTLVDHLAALAEPQKRSELGRRARRTVETRFSERAMVERYEGSLSELASTRSKRESLRRSAAAH